MTIKQCYFVADNIEALDLFGPLNTFMQTNAFAPNSYACSLVSSNGKAVRTYHGQQIQVDYSTNDQFSVDDLILCGGFGIRTLTLSPSELASLRELASKASRVISICTGAFLLAQIIPERSLSLTTHWRHCTELSEAFPKIRVDPNALFLDDSGIWSSAGVLSGVDLALAIIRKDKGSIVATSVAKELVAFGQRDAKHAQISPVLEIQSAQSFRLSSLIEWLNKNIYKNISVQDMSSYIHLSERQLGRLFRLHTGVTPAAFFRRMKLDHAFSLLNSDNISVKDVSSKLGFSSYDTFRRAFYKAFHCSPTSIVCSKY
ncbi:GlxA family transcriptional regulator [Alteromonas oceanisediminis]|uniref:GlxA family transcriptional regulator n=1 Tax=Alteromonas oceanisediminis TaxID=2836180 RepID=UPI001BD9D9D6|nr:helix-turn-helix domain-containing protein [Alteromonas oceanisediminis]MBT0587946.1 helix-turn-helix domain-containing protein [Alteromonas oceanisediminis]